MEHEVFHVRQRWPQAGRVAVRKRGGGALSTRVPPLSSIHSKPLWAALSRSLNGTLWRGRLNCAPII